ncbi:hypothetical protein HPB50_010187 [Hyalomma asiaticum]|uniref:Uncharacterized protein n=1 Tax=Hyalomma asiaticum TaxID=266040 RepID=A0ACB7TFA0_HYAAI|nr:hypothetical protein HPB50_010187 [Hyalomma asiaticum]
MAATSVVVRPRGMAPTGYRCPICQQTTKSFRSLLHHVQWWHGFCRDAPSSPHPRSEGEVDSPDVSCPNKANDQVTEGAACQSFGQNPTPNNAYSSTGTRLIVSTIVSKRRLELFRSADVGHDMQKSIGLRLPSTTQILWLASACPFLEVVAYVTVSHVTLPEALWSLGAGCRRVKTLIVPPLDPLQRMAMYPPSCQMCSRVMQNGMMRSCVNLSSFEIDRGGDIDESSAAVLVEAGLKRIQYLYLTHTVVSPGAVIILHGCCPRLKEINLVLHRRDFQSTSAFGNFVAGFGALQQREPFDTFVRLSLTDDRNYFVEDVE